MPITPDDMYKQRGRSLALPSYRLCELDTLCKLLQISRKAATLFCRAAHVPLLYIGTCSYYNEFTLERAIFLLTRPGGPGFAGPNTDSRHTGNAPTEFDSTLDSQFQDPSVMMELVAAQGRNMPGAARVAELLKKSSKKPHKEKQVE